MLVPIVFLIKNHPSENLLYSFIWTVTSGQSQSETAVLLPLMPCFQLYPGDIYEIYSTECSKMHNRFPPTEVTEQC